MLHSPYELTEAQLTAHRYLCVAAWAKTHQSSMVFLHSLLRLGVLWRNFFAVSRSLLKGPDP